jgi:purine-nucleoside phosphorylase
LIGILTGTGLGDSVRSVRVSEALAYKDLPHFPVSTVPGHAGQLLCGEIGHQPVIVMQGRFHLYEGYSPLEITFPIRVMQQLGVGFLIVTNAAGGLNPRYQTGDILLIADHINLTGANPLVGTNLDEWGPRFPDMTRAYDPQLKRLAAEGARAAGYALKSGVYVGLRGPSLETPAEMRFLRTIGADVVGFSTVQEVIVAVHAGMRVLGLTTITNLNNPDDPVPATVEGIIAVAREAAPRVDDLVRFVAEHADDL